MPPRHGVNGPATRRKHRQPFEAQSERFPQDTKKNASRIGRDKSGRMPQGGGLERLHPGRVHGTQDDLALADELDAQSITVLVPAQTELVLAVHRVEG